MRRITFDPATLDADDRAWFNDWLARAADATAKFVTAWERWYAHERGLPPPGGTAGTGSPPRAPRFNADIWTEFKNRFLETRFGNKCVYCETANPVRWPVEVEHFRPKGEVGFRTAQGSIARARTRDSANAEIDHPGYFWLAYNWRNLLPCCKRCNSGKGKNTQFPITKGYLFLRQLSAADGDAFARATASTLWPGWYYCAPEDLDLVEEPQLVNPCLEDPATHITFGLKGIEAGVTEKGRCTIQTFDLADEGLRQQRQKAQEDGIMNYLFLLTAFKKTGSTIEDAKKEALKKLTAESASLEYSAAVLSAIPVYWKQLDPGG